MRWWIAVLGLTVLSVAWARPKKGEVEAAARAATDRGPAASASEIPALANLLAKAGWTPTPELSGVFRAGSIFETTAIGHRPLADNCIAATPRESTYTAADLVTSLQAGVSVGGPLASGGAYAGIVKKVKFGTPIQVSIPGIDLELSKVCEDKLKKLPMSRIQSAYVVQEVLKAEISEQTCGKVDARGRFVGLGSAEAEYTAACAQASLEPVAVGYRTVPLAELLGLTIADNEPPPRGGTSGSGSASGGGFDSSGTGTGPSGYTMMLVPAGTYEVGCTASQSGCSDDEKPAHSVKLSRGTLMGKTEVTQGLYQSVMSTNPAKFTACGPTCPVEQVRWVDAAKFANALSKKDGLEACYTINGDNVSWPRGLGCTGYRLPTEAEWEVAARGGRDTLYAGGAELSAVGWTSENSNSSTHPVGQKAANGYGLYDMTGNVWEWTWDWYGAYGSGTQADPQGAASGSRRVLRGGGWYVPAANARVASRNWFIPAYRFINLGFRLARSYRP